jgi:hypothetical protein
MAVGPVIQSTGHLSLSLLLDRHISGHLEQVANKIDLGECLALDDLARQSLSAGAEKVAGEYLACMEELGPDIRLTVRPRPCKARKVKW